MKPSNLDLSLLVAIYELARDGEPANVLNLAERVQQPAYLVLESALRLDASGCLDASRLRLTFRGLAIAEAERRARRKTTPMRKAVKRAATSAKGGMKKVGAVKKSDATKQARNKRSSGLESAALQGQLPEAEDSVNDPLLCADHFNAQALQAKSATKLRAKPERRG